MRGTCSEGFHLRFAGAQEQILPVPFADMAGQTMLPVSHLLWASVWLGIATDAINRARKYLRQQVRGRANVSMMAHRLARGVGLLQLMQARLSQAVRAYETHPNVLTRLILMGRLIARKNSNGHWLISRESLERWNARRVRRTPGPSSSSRSPL